MKRVLYAACLVSLLYMVGCSGKVHRPDIPRALDRGSKKVFYGINEFDTDFKAYKAAYVSDLTVAQRLRDAMINRIRVDIEMNYRAYESALFIGRARGDVAWDFLEQGLTFATTVSNGERAKTVLAAVLSGVRGTRLSFDKNFFREKTIEIIMAKMQANRDKVKNIIVQKMDHMSVPEYPFEEAWVDLTEFFYAGTLQGGIQALANEAGQDAAETKEETENIEINRIINATVPVAGIVDRRNTRRIRDKFNQLHTLKDVEAAKAALTELEVDVKHDAKDDDIWILLDKEISKINTVVDGKPVIDQAQVSKVKKALKIK